jgi:hypothetical protein
MVLLEIDLSTEFELLLVFIANLSLCLESFILKSI